MKFERITNSVPFRDILNEFVSLYLKEYGEFQLKEISRKVHSSNLVNKFLIETNHVKVRPLRDDFLGLIHSIIYFTFAKPEKISIAATIALQKWQREVAIPNNIEDNGHLNETFFDIIEKCKGFKIQNSNTDNFFSKFYKIIEEKFSEVSLVEKELLNKLNDKEFMMRLVIQRTYEDSYKSMIEKLYLSFDYYKYIDEEERKKFNNQRFEISVIVIAVIGFVIESDNKIKEIYYDSYSKFIGIKIDELSKQDEYSQIFYTDDFELFMTITDRIDLYKYEIKKLIENYIHTPPYGIFYYFFLHPGYYYPDAEFTIFEETMIINSIDEFSTDVMSLSIAIKEIFAHIKNQLV